MSRLEHDLERDLRQIADRATPSPDAWAQIQSRIADQDPIQETEIIMLMENTTTTRRWPLVAAAAAVLALVVAGVALIVRDDGEQLPADVPPTPTAVVQPDPIEPDAVEPEVDEAIPVALPDALGALDAASYSVDSLGVPLTFAPPPLDDVDPWRVQGADDIAVTVGPNRSFVSMNRIGSFYDADEAQDPEMSGLGSVPADDVDGWILRNGIVVDERSETTVSGYPATFRQVRAPAGAGDATEQCPAEQRPCVGMSSASADLQSTYDGVASGLFGDRPHFVWIVELGEFEPLMIWSHSLTGDEGWLDEVTPFVDSIELGEPAPAVEGGSARVPERITVIGDMTVTQTGERDLDGPWPIERTGPIVGDINGTHSGTGISSPNGAEVTLEWTMDVTIDGLGTGTLTLRSDEIWTGDAARTAVDVVLGGTGDFEGVTGYGSTVHTDDGPTFTTEIELHLTRPTG
jgi:hypothetical protein